MSKQLYIAYGTHLDCDLMKGHYQTAQAIAKGWLFDYRLVFQGDKSLANVIQQADGEVPVVIYEIDAADAAKLEKDMAAFGYTKGQELIEVAGEMKEALLYSMKSDKYGLPRAGHLATISKGYKDFNFPTDILVDAVLYSTVTTIK